MSDQEPAITESVQLTRIEGVINLVDYKVTSMISQVDAMKKDISTLQTDVHTLQLESASREAKSVAVAVALEKSDEVREHKAELAWNPVSKLITAIVGLGVIADFFLRLWVK